MYLRIELEASQSKIHKIKMLVGDIDQNRYRVQSIFNRLDDASDRNDVLLIFKGLKQEVLL